MKPSSASLRCDMSACGSLLWLRVSGKEHRCRCHLSTLPSYGIVTFSAQRGESLILTGENRTVHCSSGGQPALAEQICMLLQLLRLVGARYLGVALTPLLEQIEHVADALHKNPAFLSAGLLCAMTFSLPVCSLAPMRSRASLKCIPKQSCSQSYTWPSNQFVLQRHEYIRSTWL